MSDDTLRDMAAEKGIETGQPASVIDQFPEPEVQVDKLGHMHATWNAAMPAAKTTPK